MQEERKLEPLRAGHYSSTFPKKASNSLKVAGEVCMSLTIWPFSRTTIRSHTSVTWLRSWLETKTVTPCLEANSLIIPFRRIWVVGSRLAKGSSRIITSGSPIKEATIPAFFWFPLDKSRRYFFCPRISPWKKSSYWAKCWSTSAFDLPRSSPIK